VRYGESHSEGGIGEFGVTVNSLRDFCRSILFVLGVDGCEGCVPVQNKILDVHIFLRMTVVVARDDDAVRVTGLYLKPEV